ncbi:MAG: T9SS type A sorting domain-containing protein [Bacteroidota bacterium]|nr:T9SS type A sorting domain-containing protein [Bacteroidota bacterium]
MSPKYFALILLISFARIATAQEAAPLTPGSDRELRHALKVSKLGDRLYRECDVFRRVIDHQLLERPASEETVAVSTEPLQPLGDTSLDITHTSSDESETTVAISRTNPNVIVVGFNDAAQIASAQGMTACVSTDAGNTWSRRHLPKVNYHGANAWCDPILTCDDSGMFYYAFLIVSPSLSLSDIMVGRSTDGLNWVLGSPVVGDTIAPTKLQDKPTIAVDRDPNSPYHGRLYIAWSEYPSLADTLWDGINYMAYSDDHGVSWSKPLEYSTAFGHFATLRIGKGGTVFIASNNFRNDTIASFAMEVSHDGGKTFSEYPIAMRQKGYPVDHNVYTYPMLKGSKGFRVQPYICFDLDPETNDLFAVYGSYDTIKNAAREFIVRSTDEGTSWSSSIQVGDLALLGRDHCMPWVTFDASTKKAYVEMYSSEEDTANMLMRRVRYSFDTPTKTEQIGTRLFDPRLASAATGGRWANIGDYTYSDAFGGTFVDVWAENRPPSGKDGDVFAYVSSPATHAGVIRQINAPRVAISDLSPNPVHGDQIRFTLTGDQSREVLIHVQDVLGHEVLSTSAKVDVGNVTNVTLDIGKLAAGSYLIAIDGNDESVCRRFVIVR